MIYYNNDHNIYSGEKLFGYIKPAADELKVKEYSFYRAVYCGLCRSLGKYSGTVAEVTLSYDFVFLALVALALNEDKITVSPKRCFIHPLKKRPMLDVCHSLELTARVSALLSYYKVKDDLADKSGLKKLPSYLALPFVSYMRYRSNSDDSDYSTENAVRSSLAALSELEKDKVSSPDPPAEQFGILLGEIFAFAITDETKKRIAREIGRHTGRWIYIADALDDYSKDIKNGEYNPFSETGKPDEAAIVSALTQELIGIERALDLIDFRDEGIENIIKNIIYIGMPNVMCSVISEDKK